ncbi:MAG: hypothetical protein JO362_03260, partial [Streptomycetaceae bacterium]|nr:hypothetical protein [Streptomycetaceae bacterium]
MSEPVLWVPESVWTRHTSDVRNMEEQGVLSGSGQRPLAQGEPSLLQQKLEQDAFAEGLISTHHGLAVPAKLVFTPEMVQTLEQIGKEGMKPGLLENVELSAGLAPREDSVPATATAPVHAFEARETLEMMTIRPVAEPGGARTPGQLPLHESQDAPSVEVLTVDAPSVDIPLHDVTPNDVWPGWKDLAHLEPHDLALARARARVLARGGVDAMASRLGIEPSVARALLRGERYNYSLAERLENLVDGSRLVRKSTKKGRVISIGAGETLYLRRNGNFRFRTLQLPGLEGLSLRFDTEGIVDIRRTRLANAEGQEAQVDGAIMFPLTGARRGLGGRVPIPGTEPVVFAEWMVNSRGALRSFDVPVTGAAIPPELRDLRIHTTYDYGSDPNAVTASHTVLDVRTGESAAGFQASTQPGGILLTGPTEKEVRVLDAAGRAVFPAPASSERVAVSAPERLLSPESRHISDDALVAATAREPESMDLASHASQPAATRTGTSEPSVPSQSAWPSGGRVVELPGTGRLMPFPDGSSTEGGQLLRPDIESRPGVGEHLAEPVHPEPVPAAALLPLGRNLMHQRLGHLLIPPPESGLAPQVVNEAGEVDWRLTATPLSGPEKRVLLQPADGTVRQPLENMVVSAVSGDVLEGTLVSDHPGYYWRINYAGKPPTGVLINWFGEVAGTPARLVQYPTGGFDLIDQNGRVVFMRHPVTSRGIDSSQSEAEPPGYRTPVAHPVAAWPSLGGVHERLDLSGLENLIAQGRAAWEGEGRDPSELFSQAQQIRRTFYRKLLVDARGAVEEFSRQGGGALQRTDVRVVGGFTVTPLGQGGHAVLHHKTGLLTVLDAQSRWVSRQYLLADSPRELEGLKVTVAKSFQSSQAKVVSYRLEGDSERVALFEVAPLTADASAGAKKDWGAFIATNMATGHRYAFDTKGTHIFHDRWVGDPGQLEGVGYLRFRFSEPDGGLPQAVDSQGKPLEGVRVEHHGDFAVRMAPLRGSEAPTEALIFKLRNSLGHEEIVAIRGQDG